jgi:hypothetical protein
MARRFINEQGEIEELEAAQEDFVFIWVPSESTAFFIQSIRAFVYLHFVVERNVEFEPPKFF